MKKLFVMAFLMAMLFSACGPIDPNSHVNDACLIQITDNNERAQEFVSRISTISFSVYGVNDNNESSYKYISVSFQEYNASTVQLNLGKQYKISIIPIYTNGELIEIQNRLGKNFANNTVMPVETPSATPIGNGIDNGIQGISN